MYYFLFLLIRLRDNLLQVRIKYFIVLLKERKNGRTEAKFLVSRGLNMSLPSWNTILFTPSYVFPMKPV